MFTKKANRFLIAAVLIAVSVGGYFYWKQLSDKAPYTPAAPTVNAFLVKPKPIVPESSFVAKIESQDSVGLRARVSGFLQERLFKEGDVVQKGQPLFIIERVNFEAAVREAQANYAKATAHSINAKAQYDRTKTLFKTKDVSEARLDEAKATYESAAAEVDQTKARLDLARQDLDYTQITAPMTGKIGESKFSVGELIGPSSGILATLVTTNPIDAVFSISENQLLILQQLFKDTSAIDVRFITSNGKTYDETGKISFVDVTLDEAMNTLKVKASFPNTDNKLISGQYGRILIKGSTPINKLAIPMRAIQRDMNSSYVYVITPENTIEKRTITEGTELSDFEVIVDTGLTENESVVIDGFQKIMPKMMVKAVYPADTQK